MVNGAATAAAKLSTERFDVVLLDLQLNAGHSGWTIYRDLRADRFSLRGTHKDTPVIIHTGDQFAVNHPPKDIRLSRVWPGVKPILPMDLAKLIIEAATSAGPGPADQRW